MNVFCIKNGIIEKRRKGKRIYLNSHKMQRYKRTIYMRNQNVQQNEKMREKKTKKKLTPDNA